MGRRALPTFRVISELFSRWIDSVVEFAVAGLGRFVSPHTARLTEDENGEFVVQTSGGANFDRVRILENGIEYNRAAPPVLAGKHIDLFLRPDRFLFRPLELPNRASEFMPGIVRSQIDRLTPWNAADTAFGWSGPAEIDDGKMEITIVATPLALIRPYTQAIADIGVHSIAVFTALPEADFDKSPIKVWEQKGRGSKDVGRIRQALVVALASAGITAGVALGADVMMSIGLATQRDELSRQISGIRSAGGFGRASDAQRALGRRKHDAPLTVLVLETLAKVLPDQTHVTELQLEGNKVRLTGITRDAPSLIGLIEQSNRFTRATFFAPTTRSTSNSGDLFHIEAVIKPSRSPS